LVAETAGSRAEAWALARAFIGFARWRAGLAALLIALGSVVDGLGLLFLVPVLGLVVAVPPGHPNGVARNLLGRAPPDTRLLLVLLGFAGLMLVRGEVLRRRDQITEALQLAFVEHVRLRLVRRLATAGWPAVAGTNHARVLQALSVEIHQLGVASGAALLAAVAMVMLAAHCVLALVLSPALGGLAVVLAVAAGLVSRPALMRSKQLGRSIIETHVGMAEGAAAFLDGLKLALAQGLEDRFMAGYAAAAASAMRDRVQFQALKSRLANLSTGTAALAGGLTLFTGLTFFHLPPPVIITLLVVLSRMGALAATVQHGVQQVAHSLPGYAAILSVEAGLVRPAPPSVIAASMPDHEAALVFDRVTYAHDPQSGRAPELEAASVTIRQGAFIGIAGPSGVGKTTLLDLAAGLLWPGSGAVHAFGQVLTPETVTAHRAQLAYVAQDPFLFDDTVRANLAWAAPERTEAEMLQALEATSAQNLLARLAHGLDTRIGHRGGLLSAGERQRLALACALLRRPRLLLLDEATNAIDVAGEAAILHLLTTLNPRATILMVAHRMESLRLCDEILQFPGPVLRLHAGNNLTETKT
jgi:ATP-binding cassette, subfamily C, bacterial